MALQPGAIAGISVAGAFVACVIIWVIYVVIKRRKRNAEYLERCGQLRQKYARNSGGSDVVANFPHVDPSYVRTPLPGQQFTARELNPEQSGGIVLFPKAHASSDEDLERKPFAAMHSAFEPEGKAALHQNYGTEQQTVTQEPLQKEAEDVYLHPAQVFFSVEYDTTLGVLKVFLDQAKNLKPKEQTKVCDPYCTVSVLPGELKKESQVVKNTTDPSFQEHFSFVISESEYHESSIQIMFFTYDQFSQHHCLGVVDQSLEGLKAGKKEEFWRKIYPPFKEQAKETAGELLLRLGYQAVAEKLTVVLLKVRSLKEITIDNEIVPPDPYIRVAITHDGSLLKKKKTSTKTRTCDPTFNQAINFSVPIHLLPQIEIQFDVVHEDEKKVSRAERKNIIGSLEISPHSNGEEMEHWRDLMSNRPLARWHYLTVKKPEEGTLERQNTISEIENVPNDT